MPAEKPGDGVPVQGTLGPVLGQLVAILASIGEFPPPLRVRDGRTLDVVVHPKGKGGLPSDAGGVGFKVDLVVGGHHFHLFQNACEVAHPAGNIAFEVGKLAKELQNVILIRVEDSIAVAKPVDALKVKCVALAPPQGAKVAEVTAILERAEYVVGMVHVPGGKERPHTSKGTKALKRRGHLQPTFVSGIL